MTTTLFVQIRCKPGTAYNVADEIGLREIHSELYSISGDFDLLLKLRVPSGEDIVSRSNELNNFGDQHGENLMNNPNQKSSMLMMN